MFLYKCTNVPNYACMYASMYACTHFGMYSRTYVCMYVHIHVCICAYVYVCISIYLSRARLRSRSCTHAHAVYMHVHAGYNSLKHAAIVALGDEEPDPERFLSHTHAHDHARTHTTHTVLNKDTHAPVSRCLPVSFLLFHASTCKHTHVTVGHLSARMHAHERKGSVKK